MLAVVTHRGRPELLDETLAALGVPKGVGRRVIISDGPYDGRKLAGGWELYLLPRSGQRAAMFWTLDLARRAREDLLMLERDVDIVDPGLAYRMEVPADCAALSFFHPHTPRRKGTPHVERLGGGHWHNSQAVAIPRRTLDALEGAEYTTVAKRLWPHGFAEAFGHCILKTAAPMIGIVWPNHARQRGQAASPWTLAAAG